MIQGTPVNIIVGSHVWVEDPEAAWIDGEVLEIKGSDATILTTDGKTVSQSPHLKFNFSSTNAILSPNSINLYPPVSGNLHSLQPCKNSLKLITFCIA